MAKVMPFQRPVANPSGRPPPADVDSERTLVGYVMWKPLAFDVVASIVSAEMFFSEPHQLVWSAIEELATDGADVGEMSVRQYLHDRQELARVGGAGELHRMAVETAAPPSLEKLARRIRDLWRLRQFGAKCWEFAAAHYGDVGEVQGFLESSLAEFEKVSLDDDGVASVSVRDSLGKVFAAYAGDRPDVGLSTGLAALDRKIGKLLPGSLMIVGARPGMGKSALAVQLAMNIAGTVDDDGVQNGAVLFSMEMLHDELSLRMVCAQARVDSKDVKANQVSRKGWADLTEAASRLAGMPIDIVDKPGLTPLAVRAHARKTAARWAREINPATGKPFRKLAVIVVDYLQKMNGRGMVSKNANREEEVAKCSGAMKDLAQQLKIPLVLLSQVGRGTEKSRDKRPTMADLRESGSVEADADIVCLMYRDEYYLKERTPAEKRGLAEIIVDKQRAGATGTVYVKFWDRYTVFADWDGPDPEVD